MKIKDYYQKESVLKKILNSVEEPGHRIWKVEFTDGVFKQNNKKINSTKKLKEFLLKENKVPSKVYVSVARFMSPERVYGKKTKATQWKIADSLFLGSDLLFDLDSEKDLTIAHKDGKTILNFMSHFPDYQLINIRYSGTKGFHILYKDMNPVSIASPLSRIMRTEEKRRRLVQSLPDLQTIDGLHKEIIVDQFRVHAALGTVKAKTGHKVQEVPLIDFLSLPTKALKKKYQVPLVRPTKPMIVDERILTSTTGKERTRVISYPYYYHFIDNMVHGTKKGYITVLKYPLKKKVRNLIVELQKKYGLGDMYMYVYKNIQMWVSCKLVSKARLEKILKTAKPMNLSSQMYYGHTWIPISEAVDKNGKVIWEKAKYVGCYKSKDTQGTYSKPHAHLFGLKFKNMAGNKENKICKAIITEGT